MYRSENTVLVLKAAAAKQIPFPSDYSRTPPKSQHLEELRQTAANKGKLRLQTTLKTNLSAITRICVLDVIGLIWDTSSSQVN